MNRLLITTSIAGFLLILTGIYVLVSDYQRVNHLAEQGGTSERQARQNAEMRRIQEAHLAERIKPLKDALERVRVQIVAMSDQLARRRQDLTGVLRTVGDLKRDVGILGQRPTTQAAELDAMNFAIAGLRTELKILTARSALKADLEATNKGLGSLKREIKIFVSRPAVQRSELVTVKQSVDQLRVRLKARPPSTPPKPVDLTPLRQAIKKLRQDLTGLARQPVARPADLKSIEGGIDQLRRDLDAIAVRPAPKPVNLAPLHRSISEIRGQLKSLSARPVASPDDLAPLTHSIHQLRREVDALAARPLVNAEKLTPAQRAKTLRALESRIVALAKRVSDLALDLSVLRESVR